MTISPIRAALGDRWPVAEGPGWMLVNGDCLAVMAAMPDRCVNHVVTDPPYEAEAHTKARRTTSKLWRTANDYGKAVDEYEINFVPITEEQRSVSCGHFARIADGWALAFCQVEAVDRWRASMESAGAKWRRALAWIKPDGTPQLTGDRPAQGFECIAASWCGPGRSEWNAGGKRGVYIHCVNDYGRNARPHPTTKPIDLMLEIIADFTDPGDLVLDAFAGSATTGVACLRLGRLFVGIEKDPAYFEIACRRMRGDEAKPRPEQPSLFSDLTPRASLDLHCKACGAVAPSPTEAEAQRFLVEHAHGEAA